VTPSVAAPGDINPSDTIKLNGVRLQPSQTFLRHIHIITLLQLQFQAFSTSLRRPAHFWDYTQGLISAGSVKRSNFIGLLSSTVQRTVKQWLRLFVGTLNLTQLQLQLRYLYGSAARNTHMSTPFPELTHSLKLFTGIAVFWNTVLIPMGPQSFENTYYSRL